MQTITITFNLASFLSFAFLSFLTILATKAVLAIGAALFLPKTDGASFWVAAALLSKMMSRWFLSLICATLVALIVCLTGGSLAWALGIAAILGLLGSII